MTPLLQAIGDILRPKIDNHPVRIEGPIRLEETDPLSTCEPVTLRRSGPTLVLKLDLPFRLCSRQGCQLTLSPTDRLFPLFRIDREGVPSICDYIIFCQGRESEGSPLFVLFCELKSGEIRAAKRQIENGRLLVDYVVAMARYHGGVGQRPQVEARGIVFSPKGTVPKGNLHTVRCAYVQHDDWVVPRFAYYRSGSTYPLSHFCV